MNDGNRDHSRSEAEVAPVRSPLWAALAASVLAGLCLAAARAQAATIVGIDGQCERITGTGAADVIVAGAGNDTIVARGQTT